MKSNFDGEEINLQDTPATTTSTLKYSPPTVSNVAFNAGTIASPPWLQEATPNSNTATPTETTPTSSAATNEIPRMILYTRVINLALSVLIIIVSLLSLAQTQSATTGVLASYLIVFACLLCCFETHLKQISKVIAINFGFMYSAKARSAFMLFIGTILFSFNFIGMVIGLCMIANAVFNAYIIFKYPEYENIQRNDAQSDIKEFLVSHPAFAKQFVDAGVDIITSNPELAKQSTAAFFSLASNQQRSASAGNSKLNNDVSYTSV